jgi:glycosyltransferase involved in cell wall biosynthesis
MDRTKVLFVHHFPLSSVTGVTVMFDEILRLIPSIGPGVEAAYQSFDAAPTPADFVGVLDTAHADATCVIGINLHIELGWDFSVDLYAWCRSRGVPAYAYIHDYWPHHRDNTRALVSEHGVCLIASTPFILDALAKDGFTSGLVPVGVPLPNDAPTPAVRATPKVIASAGRLVPRKRFEDIVRAFATAQLGADARLYLRLLPSLVYPKEKDEELFRNLENEAQRNGAAASVQLDRNATPKFDYAPYSIFVCSSEYEGFSMSVAEAPYYGRPAIVSDIPPHRAIVNALFGDRAADFLYPVGDYQALAALLRDEVASGRRSNLIAARRADIQATVQANWSLRRTARDLVRLARNARTPSALLSPAAAPQSQ